MYEDGFRETISKAEQLREREAAYRASLPTDPAEKLKAIQNLWINDDYFEKGSMREAEVIAFALESMVETCDPENIPEERDAMRWFTSRLIECQRAESKRIRRAMDLAQTSQ